MDVGTVEMDPVRAIEEFCCSLARPNNFNALHGEIGVIRGNYIITSPNMNWVPKLQLQKSSVQLCKDMRFGENDYMQLPQWYHDAFPHLAAVPQRPSEGLESPYGCMFSTPTSRDDFALLDARAADKFPGFLKPHIMAPLRPLKDELKADANRFLERRPTEGLLGDIQPQVSGAISALVHTWLVLDESAAGFEEKCLELAEFQRAWLDLKGMMNWADWSAEFDRTRLRPTTPRLTMGCFTESLTMAMRLFDMNIPLWLVRPKAAVLQGKIYIKLATSRTWAAESLSPPVCIQRHNFLQEIYNASPRVARHYIVQRAYSRTRPVSFHLDGLGQAVYRPIPHNDMGKDAHSIILDLATMRAQGPPLGESTSSTGAGSTATSAQASSRQQPTSSSSKSSHSSRNQGPYTKFAPMRGVKFQPNTRTEVSPWKQGPKFEEIDGVDQPYTIGAWRHAVANLDFRRPRMEEPKTHSYALPPPFLFMGGNAGRIKQVICSWLHLRRMWLAQLRVAPEGSLVLKCQTWRDVLKFSLGGPPSKQSNVGGDNMAKIQSDLKKLGMDVSANGRVITMANGQLLQESHDIYAGGASRIDLVSWRGRPINVDGETIPPYVVTEILYEMHELGFRQDLIQLDRSMTGSDEDIRNRQDRLAHCWHTSGDAVDIEWPADEDVGLASVRIRNRLPYLRGLYAVCCTWASFRMPEGMEEMLEHGLSERTLRDLEGRLVCAVAQVFYDVFSRAMVAPRRLFCPK